MLTRERLRRVDGNTLRAAWWTVRAVRAARHAVHTEQTNALVLPRAPAVGLAATPGVNAVLRRRDDTCLVRALVRQAWLAGQGRDVDVIVGVTAPSDFRAHAWLDGDSDGGYLELARYPVRTPRRAA